jgi:hypothetical protein
MKENTADLTARDVYQVLKDVALGTQALRLVGGNALGEMHIDVDGWMLTLTCEDGKLSHCQTCESPDGRSATVDTWQHYGTDPIKLLSIWEHAQLQRLLKLPTPQE